MDFFKSFKELILNYSKCKITTNRLRMKKQIIAKLTSSDFKDNYREYMSLNDEKEITTECEINYDVDMKLNYTKNPIFYMVLFALETEFIEPIEEFITPNMLRIAFLFSCTKGIKMDFSIFVEESIDFLSLAFVLVLNSSNEEMINFFISNNIFKLIGNEIVVDAAVNACSNGCLTLDLVKKLIELNINLDPIFEMFDIYESHEILMEFMNSKNVSQEARDKKFESIHINSEAAKIFIKSGISKKVFDKIFIKVCENVEQCIGPVYEKKVIDGITYKEGDEINYFTTIPMDHIISRFINSSMMTKDIYNKGISKINPKFIYLPRLLVNEYTSDEIIEMRCRDKNLKYLYEEAKADYEEKKLNENKQTETDICYQPKEDELLDMEGPHSRSNYLDDDKMIIIGAAPLQEDIPTIIDTGVTTFINLTEQKNYVIPNSISYYNFPIKTGQAPSMKKMNEILEIVATKCGEGGKVYIHCTGGHGRASVVAAVIIGKLNGLDACSAISYVEDCRNSRADTSRNFIPVPETNKQVEFIGKMLGVPNGKMLPDRSDNTWLQRVRKEKIER